MMTSLKVVTLTTIVMTLLFFLPNYETTQKPNYIKSANLQITSSRSETDSAMNPYGRIVFEATIANTGAKPFHLVHPGDGSTDGWRSPTIKWSVVKKGEYHSDPSSWKFREEPRCGNVNSLDVEDITLLEPEGSVKLDKWLGAPEVPMEPGVYSLQMYFENDPKMKWSELGFHDWKLMRRVRKTDPIAVLSNEIFITVI